ncbi:MAG TPA: DUF2199 domain-containing protein [Acidobacteriaceae bacterium]|nr:DUF2199 domain-containing protein [Acidobacteriaceae bacterium]
MTDKIHCDTHGDSEKTYVCTHLVGEDTGLGFNRKEPTGDNPFPDAWCDNCELIRAASGGWNEESEMLASISLLCAGCYERARIRNERPRVTLDDLADLRWKCDSCEEWHTGPCLDYGYSAPFYWRKELEDAEQAAGDGRASFLNTKFCAVEDEHFFVRGIIHLPIIGTGESFRWGVWGSLSRENFEKLRTLPGDEAAELPPMFSWLSTRLPDYPETLNLRMYAHPQRHNQRPHFRLEKTDHPLACDYHQGITPERVRELMRRLLPEVDF